MKNKKLLILLCIPLIISVLVFPLCSFTTTDGSYLDNILYQPQFKCSVGYAYHRVTSTIDKYYFGYIHEFNNTFVYGNDVRSIRREASDYVIVGSTSINYAGTTSSYLVPSSYSAVGTSHINSSVALYSEDKSLAYFDGRFIFDGLSSVSSSGVNNPLNYISIYLADDVSDSLHSYSITELNCSCAIVVHRIKVADDGTSSVEYQTILHNIIGTDLTADDINRIEGDQGNFVYNTKGFSLGGIVEFCLASSNIPLDTYIDQVVLDFEYPIEYDDSSLLGTFGFKYCCVTDRLYPQYAYDNTVYDNELVNVYNNAFNSGYQNGYDSGYDTGYSEGNAIGYEAGLNQGINVGISNAPSVWSSFSTFLSNTVGGFLDMNITPNVTISGILSVIISIGLVILFLRLFAGG